MRQKLTLFRFLLTPLVLLLMSTGWVNGQQTLIISEVADPGDVYQARYVELYNATDADIDLTGWQIRRYANANTTSGDIDLSGTIAPGKTYVVASSESDFVTQYEFQPDMSSGTISGNGDDTYELFNGTSVVDIYGEVGTDGSGEAWEYENSHAVRVATIGTGNTTWTASEWTIAAADVADMTPGEHTCDYPVIPDWYNLQWPGSGTIQVGGTYEVYAQIYEPGVTDIAPDAAGPGIEAWIGYSTEDTDPSTWTDWSPADYNAANTEQGNNDEYMKDIGSGLAAGEYYYASRFSLNSGPYVYGGFNGGAWDGTNNVSGVLKVTNDADSYADALGVTQPISTTISSADWDVTTPTATKVFEFNINDAGSGDGLPTEVTEVTIKAGASNTADWTQDIGGGYLEVGGMPLTIVTEPTVEAGAVTFYIEDTELDVADGGTVTVSLYIWPDQTTTDNAIVQCMIDGDAHGFAADIAAGSAFADNFGIDVTGEQFTIDVTASQLSFTTQPTDVFIGQTMSTVEVAATDANGNLDADYPDTQITLGYSGTGTMSGTTAVSTTGGTSAFSDLSFDTEESSVNLTADDGSLTQGVSNPFNVNAVPVVSLPYERDFETGDLYTDGWTTQVVTGSLDWELTSFSGDTYAEMSNYSGGNQASETWLITPGIDLSGVNHAAFTFMNAANYSGADIEVYVASDYDGFSLPSSATWSQLSPTLSGGSWADVSSGELDISDFAGETVHIAFKYTGSDSDGKTWQIDDLSVYQYISTDASLTTFTLGGQDVTGLTNLEVADPVADEGATLYVDDFTGFAGIVIDATDAAATVEVKLNDVVVDPGNYATQALADGDVVVATVTAEDGSMAYYKVNITGENRELTLTGPALPATFETGQDITFTWTSANIANVNIYAVDATKAVNQINETPIDASLGTWTYTVENGDFGVFTIRITDASDETFLNETTDQATINDVQAPERTAESPLNGATGQPLSMTLTLTFDEDIAVGIGNITVHNAADDAQVATLNVADGIISGNELSIDVSGLSYNTDYYVLYDGGIVQDIAGNDAWALTDKTAWTFKTSQEPTGDLFFSEYIEGSSNNKALEIYNGTGADIDLSAYIIRINSNGGEWTSHFELPDGKMLANGDVYVIAHADADAAILAEADTAVVNPYTGGESYVAVFNGDDVRALCKVAGTDTTIIDIIGRYDQVDPGSGWEVAGIADATGEHTLVRKNSVTEGNTDWDASAGTNADDSEWIVYGQDEFSYIGMHGSTEPALTITSPEDGSTLYTTTVSVTFDVQNFTVGNNAGGTDDGYVVYTLDAGTETNLYTTDAFDLSGLSLGTHTLEMWLVDNNGLSLDPAVTYSVTFTIDEVQALSIYDIQHTTVEGDGTYPSLYEGAVVETSGIVTAVDAGSAYFIQDGTGAWNGIYVYDTNAVSEGDEVALTGEVVEYYGLTQLANISAFEIVSSGNTLPEVTTLSTVDANMEDYESVLVKVENAECTDADVENNFGMWTVNDGSGALLIDDDLFAFTPTAGTNYNVTGVGFYSYSNSKILPRSADDIEEAVSVGEITATAVKLYPNPASDVLFISSDSDVSRVEVYNLLGQNVMSTNIESKQTELNISDLDAGMYIIKVYGENAAQTHRFIKN